MSKVAIVTDSNSGITQKQSKELGIRVIPMPFFIDGKEYLEDITLTQEEFYVKLEGDADISTSQPSVGELQDTFDEVLKDYDELVFIPMSSGLSGTCQTATMLADDYDGKVCVVNNQRISVTMRQSALDALELAKKGYSAKEIKEILEKHKFDSSIYITLETLKYLKKGGRITPAAAAIGTVLNLKPVLQIQGEKLDAYTKTRGKEAAKKKMIEAMKNDFENRFANFAKEGKLHLEAAYSGNPEEAAEWKELLSKEFPGYDIHMDPLSLSISCHIGKGALAVAVSAYLPELEA
ncbi:DegV family protein [Lachnospira pectinoschiza]|uniref:EDD domain protein, DegV family n=1 Tax=Lachnospira pectinoschiza TaxID=28052 RepID=A0A1G9TTG4_9FIRM|nr:DegV family protein [Lachnospira pectinoschiza]SDM51043.1 EDD domain protein, DegV family [Lachnospira pectinoschiza]